jgi:hypothetical protein
MQRLNTIANVLAVVSAVAVVAFFLCYVSFLIGYEIGRKPQNRSKDKYGLEEYDQGDLEEFIRQLEAIKKD